MALPPSLGTIGVYAGDPLNIILTVTGQNLTSKTFTSQIRSTAAAAIVSQSFTVTTALVGSDTVITLALTGDTAIGQADGQTRNFPTMSVFDIEQSNTSTGRLEKTLCGGVLSVTPDVTR